MGLPGVRLTALAATAVLALTGCETVPFRSSGTPPSSVIGLGGATPYVDLPRSRTVQESTLIRTPLPSPGERADRAAAGSPDVYAATGPDMLAAAARRLPARLYVPHGTSVDVIDQRTLQPVGLIRTRSAVRQIVPSWDLKTLWVSAAQGLRPIDPRTGRIGRPVKMTGPYTLHFTPDGLSALVVAGRRLEFRDPSTMALRSTLELPCPATGAADFSAGGEFLVASCDHTGGTSGLIRVDWLGGKVTHTLTLRSHPQDVRLGPDGTVFYVADDDQVRVIDATRLTQVGTVGTAPGSSSLLPSRDGASLYVGGRNTVSVLSFATRALTHTWKVPTGSNLGGVSADGRTLWLYGPEQVLALSPSTGRPLHHLATPATHLTVYPQPGRYSLGQAFR
ncbi:MAG: hypothetical protein ABIS86_12995 [Streptosporangiaceae bacterium]